MHKDLPPLPQYVSHAMVLN